MKSKKLIGDVKIDNSALTQMQLLGDDGKNRWYAYQNHDMGSPTLGHVKFLRCGPDCGIKEAPKGTLPDFQNKGPGTAPSTINWRYQYVGVVNIETGEIEEG